MPHAASPRAVFQSFFKGDFVKDFFWTPQKSAFGEITEKRSKFISEIRPICDEQAAADIIEEVRHKHRDARHTVFSYLLIDGKKR